MSKNKIVFFIGTVLILMPHFLGFPLNWENFLLYVFGTTLVVLSFSAAAKRRAGARRIRRIKEQEINPETSVQNNANVTMLPDIAIKPSTSVPTGDEIPPTT